MLIFGSFYSWEYWKKITQLLNTDNNKNQNTKMMSEGSENWSNDVENSALITGKNDILKYIQIKSYFK